MQHALSRRLISSVRVVSGVGLGTVGNVSNVVALVVRGGALVRAAIVVVDCGGMGVRVYCR